MQVKSIAGAFCNTFDIHNLPFVIKILVLSIFEWSLKTGFTVLQALSTLFLLMTLTLWMKFCWRRELTLLVEPRYPQVSIVANINGDIIYWWFIHFMNLRRLRRCEYGQFLTTYYKACCSWVQKTLIWPPQGMNANFRTLTYTRVQGRYEISDKLEFGHKRITY